MTELFAPVCSIAPTRRRRFLWAAWWSGPPTRDPFRKPDASSGGARTPQEALREAERACGARLLVIEPLWARAWARVLRGEPAFPPPSDSPGEEGKERAERNEGPSTGVRPPENASVWEILRVSPAAPLDEVKRAYRQRALETHPDRGGDAEAFRAVQRAYEVASTRKTKAAARPKRRRAAG